LKRPATIGRPLRGQEAELLGILRAHGIEFDEKYVFD
jgi:hypothetical protein